MTKKQIPTKYKGERKTREQQIFERVEKHVNKSFVGARWGIPVAGQKALTIETHEITNFIYYKLIKQLKELK